MTVQAPIAIPAGKHHRGETTENLLREIRERIQKQIRDATKEAEAAVEQNQTLRYVIARAQRDVLEETEDYVHHWEKFYQERIREVAEKTESDEEHE